MTARNTATQAAQSVDVRARLVEALKLDLVGPWASHAFADERLPGWVRPSNWYLTGFLIPSGTPPEKSADGDENEDFELVPESAGLAEESNEERKAAKKGFFPSSMGLSFLVPKETHSLTAIVRWGDYTPAEIEGQDGKPVSVWQRQPRQALVAVRLTGASDPVVHDVPGSGGLQLHLVQRQIAAEDLEGRIPEGTSSVSVFLVNHRAPVAPEQGEPDLAYAFQPEIDVQTDRPFVPRPDLRGARAATWDEEVADLHYADTPEYATGHGVSVDWDIVDGACRLLRTAWIPGAEVENTITVDVPGVELSMVTLGVLAVGAAADVALRPLVVQYRAWIDAQQQGIGALHGTRRDTAQELLRLAGIAADRIERGIAVLAEDADALDAFRVANRAVARALRQRLKIPAPKWKPFQL
ncbi:MAG: helicase, partial [Acidobacteria bacterium]|nr:helicase [Acidobacteriota bacterium]